MLLAQDPKLLLDKPAEGIQPSIVQEIEEPFQGCRRGVIPPSCWWNSSWASP